MLNSEAACREFVATSSTSTIAAQIRYDQDLCKAHKIPSLLVHYLPSANSEACDAIAKELCPETASYGPSITRAQYSGIVQGIKAYSARMNQFSRHEKLPSAEFEEKELERVDVETTLRVLSHCVKTQSVGDINLKTPLEDVLRTLSAHLMEPHPPDDAKPQKPGRKHKLNQGSKPGTKAEKKCYICQFWLVSHHPQYSALCQQCGDFNLASSALSLPSNLQLLGRTALVTGGRLNLGYHTALRLLRCGAKVIVSTRYPRDAETRYLAENDWKTWKERLRIVGADFRAATDVFQLVAVVKEQLREWSENGEVKLDILVNNAAQTLTDPLEKERQAVQDERRLALEHPNPTGTFLLVSSGYESRVRGGVQASRLLGSGPDPPKQLPHNSANAISVTLTHETITSNSNDTTLTTNSHEPSKSSWVQSISEIPYEDIISAHSVNTFVPLILTREFLPIMGSPHRSSPPTTKPLAYILNISSREGIFESHPHHSHKSGHHVHTNLTKAALNMLTETEAGPAWRLRRVAINSVDPGYMSAAPEIEESWKREGRTECPIGWEDGAGRVLWPVAMGEREEGKPVWGRFLKHFGIVEVDPGLGR
ncbi:NAD(P)-binding protein [Acephala macrosclerotiorum]|nr:NAD(P)-binding protein [Acephala macrosclerotiorum]